MTYENYIRKYLLIFSAMIRDDKKVLMLQKQQPVKPTIYLYTSAGKLMEQLQVISICFLLCPNYLCFIK